MLKDRSTRTLVAVVTLVAAILLAVRLVIESAPIGDWLLTGILFLVSSALWVGLIDDERTETLESVPEAAKTGAEEATAKAETTVEKAKEAVAKAEAAVGKAATVKEPVPPAPVVEPKSVPEPVVEEKAPAAVEPEEIDDLTRIEGIGPKYRDALINAGFKTFDEIAKASAADLLAALKAAGMRRPASLVTWSEQAGYAAGDDWEGLDKLQEELKGGKR
jgi:predicted flap endonuclease-1-like 5' DNA nuclease